MTYIERVLRIGFARGFRAGLSVSPKPLNEIIVLKELAKAWQFEEQMSKRINEKWSEK